MFLTALFSWLGSAAGAGTVAAASLAVGVASAVQSNKMQKAALKEQKKAAAEQKSQNAARAAQEARQRVREERVKRAQVLQASSNTGVGGGSGQAGALSSSSSQFGAASGFNAGAMASANRAGSYGQAAVDFQGRARTADQIYGLSTSIFNAVGGFNSLFPSQGGGVNNTQAPSQVRERGI
jgi:hypothetical protein